jgi:REP element-mobilizing transposase RayT
MARRPRIFAPGLLYHVIARGNQRQLTFLAKGDYEAYLARLKRYRGRYGVVLYAYCLMPNHVHLLLQTAEAPLAKFMQGLQQSYTQHFNRTREKVGHLFQGRYRAIVCEKEEYLAALVRYIHLNPVRAGLIEDAGAYPYSGHRAYLTGNGGGLVDPEPVLGMLGGRAAYRRLIQSEIGAGHEQRYYDIEDQQFLGRRGFAQRTVQSAQSPRNAPAAPVDTVVERLARRFSMDTSALRGPDRSRRVCDARAAVSYALVRGLGYRVADVAAALGRDPATVSVMLGRLGHRLASRDRAALDVAALAEM